jgi:hypothetical protein
VKLDNLIHSVVGEQIVDGGLGRDVFQQDAHRLQNLHVDHRVFLIHDPQQNHQNVFFQKVIKVGGMVLVSPDDNLCQLPQRLNDERLVPLRDQRVLGQIRYRGAKKEK